MKLEEKNMMRYMAFYKVTILVFIFSCMISCKKTKDDTKNKPSSIPVSYYLSSQDKSLFNFYYSNKIIQFSDTINNHLIFKADSLYDITTHLETDLRSGEMLQLNYKCQTTYFPNYSFSAFLTAKPNNNVDLNIQFASGTYWNDRNNDYVLSHFYFNPKGPYNLDSIIIYNKTFYNVYFYENQLLNTDIKQTIKCYYTNNKGLVAFKNNDGKFWVKD